MPKTTDSAQRRALEKNLVALTNRYPELAKQVRDRMDEHPDNIIRTGEDGAFQNILYRTGDRNVLCYDSDDPLGYSRRYVESLDLHYAPFLVFLGFGLGYQVIAALDGLSEELQIQHMVIVEKDIMTFKAALQSNDFSQMIMHPGIELVVGPLAGDLFLEFRNYFANHPRVLEYARSLKFVIMPAVDKCENRYYGEVVQAFKSAMIHIYRHMGNDPYDSLLGVHQTVSNLRPLIEDPGIVAFENCFQKRPGIVIGAGPSLSKNIHLLKEAGSKAVLIAVDAALRPLLNAGIRPHIVTNLERTAPVSALFRNLGEQKETFFVFSPVAAAETYDAFQGPKIIAHRYEPLLSWLGIPKGALTGGPLVGNFAFDIAQYLGCSSIIMVGQDLSFERTGATHVEGNAFGHDVDVYKEGAVEVEGNYGETLQTTIYFEESIKSLEVQAKSFEGVCINATEGGAKLEGTHFINLRAAIDTYCRETFDPLDELARIWSAEKGRQKDLGRELERTGTIIDQSLAEMDSIVIDCQKSIASMDELLGQHDVLSEGRPDPKILRAIRSHTKSLNDTRERFISLRSFASFETIIQGYHFDLEMRRKMTFDQFHHTEFAELESFLLLKEWFVTIGQLILSTRYAIERSKSVSMGKQQFHAARA